MIQSTYDNDLLLENRIAQYLFDRSRPSLQSVSIEANRGQVTLRGRVKTFYEKQLCICSCQRVAGVIRLIDQLEVSGYE